MKTRLLIIMAASIFWGGCAHVISEKVLKEVNRDIAFVQLLKDPMSYLGQTVLLGGVIVKATYHQEGTLLEIYQTKMNWEERPVDIDVSQGRFLALYKGFLDSEIYKKGRKVTVAGMVTGFTTLKLGEIDYHYPSLLIRDIHIWKKERREPCDPYFWYPWGMWGPWGPWYYPYWRY
jgi:outer membrane lipoprotein